MKKYLFALSMMLVLTTTAVTAQKQNQPVPPSKELVDSTRQDEVEVFSDTTSIDTAGVNEPLVTRRTVNINLTNASFQDLKEIIGSMGLTGLSSAMVFATVLFTILLVFAPILVLALIFFFIYKNRKERMRFAEQAMRNGQPVPNQAMQPQQQPAEPDIWTKGMRQVFLGIGLAVLFGILKSEIGIGVGALVICIGAGNLVIAKRQKEKNNKNDIFNY
jgi:hypothetical protein